MEAKEEFSAKVQKVLDHNRVEEDVYLRFMDQKKEDKLDQVKLRRELTQKQDTVRNRIKITKNPVMDIIPKFFMMHILHSQASMGSINGSDEADALKKKEEDTRTAHALSELKLKFGGMGPKAPSPVKAFDQPDPGNFAERAFNLMKAGPAKEEESPVSVFKGSMTQRNRDAVTKNNTFFSLIQQRRTNDHLSKIVRAKDISDKGLEMRPAARESFLMGLRPSPIGVTQEVYFVGGIGSEIVPTVDSYNLGTRH